MKQEEIKLLKEIVSQQQKSLDEALINIYNLEVKLEALSKKVEAKVVIQQVKYLMGTDPVNLKK